jgi:TPR repeat protein
MALCFFDRWFSRPHAPGISPAASDELSGSKDAEAQFSLAQRFDAGAESDQGLAAQWYRKAAEQGHCAAQFHLALMHAQGKGGLRDQTAALMWLRRAAEAGHGGAQYHLGVRLYRASKSKIGGEASELRIESLKWLQHAVAQSCRGAESAREFVLLGMTRQEAEEGEHRAQSSALAKETADN